MELYQKSKEEVLLQMGSNRDGLDEGTAAERCPKMGKTSCRKGKRSPLPQRFGSKFETP